MPVCSERDKESPDYCRDYIDYKLCPGLECFTWRDIRWCPHQIWWILQNEELLSDGIWPQPSDLIDKDAIQRALMSTAYYVKSSLTMAVVRMRLKRVHKKDIREMWEDIYDKVELWEILKRDGSDPTQLVILYISGWYPKKKNYRLWRGKTTYRARNRRPQVDTQAIK